MCGVVCLYVCVYVCTYVFVCVRDPHMCTHVVDTFFHRNMEYSGAGADQRHRGVSVTPFISGERENLQEVARRLTVTMTHATEDGLIRTAMVQAGPGSG